MGRGLHMIIYYHCNSDNALLLSFLLTCHPYIPFILVVPLALHNTLDLRRAERVRTLDALRCAFVVIAYYAAVAFRMTSMCGINRRNFIPIIELAGWLHWLRVGIVMRRSGVRSLAKAYKRFRALLPRISSVSSLNLTQLYIGWLTEMVGPAWSSLVFIRPSRRCLSRSLFFPFFNFSFTLKMIKKGSIISLDRLL